ncbi:MAG TPA: hypothetical protein VIL86_05295 [Tepidisphaeraceae bacterium]|jgi:cell fate (sporulation/competence/biofilm development) regulator YlbF (YheA/YmcA/DUF963 family)
MSVTVDHQTLEAEQMGLRTVGQVLAHLQRDNRLVVHVLIDGQEPDLSLMQSLKQSPLDGHVVYVETAEPRQMALEVLTEVDNQLAEADRLRTEAAELLNKNQNVKAMEKLSGCFSTWQHAQESVLKTAQLLRIDLNSVKVHGRTLTALLEEFTQQLRNIRASLENRDFVTLSDILTYETTETTQHWRSALQSMRSAIVH